MPRSPTKLRALRKNGEKVIKTWRWLEKCEYNHICDRYQVYYRSIPTIQLGQQGFFTPICAMLRAAVTGIITCDCPKTTCNCLTTLLNWHVTLWPWQKSIMTSWPFLFTEYKLRITHATFASSCHMRDCDPSQSSKHSAYMVWPPLG